MDVFGSRSSLVQDRIRSDAAARVAARDARDSSNAAGGLAVIAQGLTALRDRDQDRIRELEQKVLDLELALLVKTAHAEGLSAMTAGYKAAHPDSPERRDSGKRYSDGDVKTVGRIRYESAFDGFLNGKRIANPAQYRAN